MLKMNLVMLFKGIIPVYTENHTTHINTKLLKLVESIVTTAL
jgi:hypothetical protein